MIVGLALLALASTALPPKPGELKTFRDWTVGCDNGSVCKMASLWPEGGDFTTVRMVVSRDAGPNGGWIVALSSDNRDPDAVAIDGRRVARGSSTYAGVPAAAIVAAIAKGATLTALDAAGKAIGRVSLSGASAALRYIDAAQGRAGGVTAAVARGAKGADAVPAAPALPVVKAVTPGGTAAIPTPAQIAAMRKIAECDTTTFPPESHGLGGGATLVFVPCSMGAYNLSSALFVLRNGKVASALADVATGFFPADAAVAPAQVVNGSFDDGLVTSDAKGRGLGDCGVSESFAWDGTRLRLVQQAVMNECRGNAERITTWRARVVRK